MKKRPARVQSRQRSLFQRVAQRVAHVCWYGVAVVGALFAVVLIAARLLLPMVAEKKADVEALIARESGYSVRIGELDGYWDGLYPGLRMRGIAIHADGAAKPAIELAELRFSLQLLPLLAGRADIHSAVLVSPSLTLERLADGRFRISGFTPIEQTDPEQTGAFMAWLFRQNRLSVEDGELRWLDRREPGRPLVLKQVNLQLQNNGNRHRLGASAEFPSGICGSCSVVADVSGNPLLGDALRGDIYVRAREVNVERLPWAIREQLPELLRGTFSVELWSEWDESLPVAVEGDVSVADLRLPLTGLRAPLSVKQASTDLRWARADDGFSVQLDELTLALHGSPWSMGRLAFTRTRDDTSLRIDRVELPDITAFVASLRLARAQETLPYEESATLWTALKPAGVIRNVRADVSGALDAPDDFTVTADVEGLAVDAHGNWPGVRGVGGRLWVTPDEGSLTLDMRDGTLALPSLFRAPLPVARADAELRWRYQVDQWVVSTDNLVFVNDDIRTEGRLLLRLPDDAARSPYLALSMAFHDGRGANAARYYPVRRLLPATLAWMESSFVGGTVIRGTLDYEGHTRDFPFKDAPGKFEIRAKVRDGIYRYLPGWEPVTDVIADVSVSGDRFVVTGNGRIGTLRARDILVESDGAGVVRVGTNVAGGTSETLRVLRDVKLAPTDAGGWKQWVAPSLQASGNGLLGLTLGVPINGTAVRVGGEYRFLGGALRVADTPLEATRLTGSIGFNNRGVRDGRVRAQLLGDEAVLVIDSPDVEETVAAIEGRAAASALAPLLGTRLAPHVDGAIPWSGRLRLVKGAPQLSVDADLSALRVSLPAPLDRPQGFGPEKLRIRTESSAAREMVLRADAGEWLRGRLRFTRAESWRLAAGRIVFRETPSRLNEPVNLPDGEGLHLLARLGDFDLDRWLTLFGSDGTPTPAWLARVSASFRRLTYLDRDFGAIDLELARERGGWVGGVSGVAADGRLRFERDGATRVVLDLAHLRLPRPLHDGTGAGTDPRKLPALTLRARRFESGAKELGDLEFVARPMTQGWRIERIVLARPETRFEASGEWRTEYGQASSSFSAHFASDDLGKTMEALGLPDQVEGTKVDLRAKLGWNGTPADIEYASLTGSLEINADKGRFLKVDQGAARLFGILDLSAIVRYLTLDFTPVFGKGFAFDRIDGRVQIDRGNANTDALSIRGPSARLRFNGRVGLVAEDFDLTLDVYPSLSDSVTLGALAVAGPQIALWTLLVQKLFKKQIEEGTRVTYFVRGPWDKPAIVRKVVEVPAVETN